MLSVFEIHEPDTIEEASSLLREYGFDATVYAGGTELLVVMKEGLAHFPHLVNVKTVPGLDDVSVGQEFLRVGPLATHWQLERSSVVKDHAPLLAEVESMVANIRVRAAGTIGGNLCFAEPHSDPATLLMAWGATVELSATNGKRDVPIEDFVQGMFETARQEDEILTGVTLPLMPDGMAGGYQKFTLHERPTASVAALVKMKDGVIEEARIAIGSVGPVPMRVSAAENLLRGEHPNEAAFEAAAEQTFHAADPVDDIYGSIEYKRNLVRVLTVRALTTAANRVREKTNGR